MWQRFQKITSSSIPFSVLPKESQQKARKQRILLYISWYFDGDVFSPLSIFFIVFYQDRNHTIHSLIDDDDDDSCLQSQNLRWLHFK